MGFSFIIFFHVPLVPFFFIIVQGSIKSFPDYKHLLRENYVEYKHIFFTITYFYVMCLL